MGTADALLLDLDGTLLDDGSAVAFAFDAFLSTHRVEMNLEAARARWRELAMVHWRRFERHEVTFVGQRRARVRDFLGMPMNDIEADAAFEPYRTAYEAAWRPFPETVRFLELTAELPKVIVTNGDRAQQLLKLERCGIIDRFDAVLTPEDSGAWKPDPEMFVAAVRRLGAPMSRCMMIGDDMDLDILPAKALGMPAFHVNRSAATANLLCAADALCGIA